MKGMRLVLGLAPVLALAACGGAPRPQGMGTALPANPPEAKTESAALPAPPPPGPVDMPLKLKGLSGGQVVQVLGQPGFRRRDKPAEIWSYRGRACTLDVFLYDGEAGQTVAHVAVRSPSNQPERECFDELTVKAQPAS